MDPEMLRPSRRGLWSAGPCPQSSRPRCAGMQALRSGRLGCRDATASQVPVSTSKTNDLSASSDGVCRFKTANNLAHEEVCPDTA